MTRVEKGVFAAAAKKLANVSFGCFEEMVLDFLMDPDTFRQAIYMDLGTTFSFGNMVGKWLNNLMVHPENGLAEMVGNFLEKKNFVFTQFGWMDNTRGDWLQDTTGEWFNSSWEENDESDDY